MTKEQESDPRQGARAGAGQAAWQCEPCLPGDGLQPE